MPLKKGSSKKTISKNISEFHKGETYSHTMNKFGKAKADKQAVAVALSQARKSGKKFNGGAFEMARRGHYKLGKKNVKTYA